MTKIKYVKDVALKGPVMIAGWPGMGSVAMGVVDYLQRKLKAIKFAEIDVDPLTTVDAVTVEDGLASLMPIPKNTFYYARNPEIIIFKGEAQLPGREGVRLIDNVLEVAAKLKTKMIYTGAAFPSLASYKEQPQVHVACNKALLKEPLLRFGLSPMESGHISGLNGLLLGFAGERNMDAACLLATMPQYAVSLPNPKASLAILEVLEKIIGFKLDVNEIYGYIKEMDEKMAIIEDKVKGVLTMEVKAPEVHHTHSSQDNKTVPPYIMKKIEKLFIEAASDKSKAVILKSELDRWDLYKTYEDRFLDLFKENQ